MAKRDKEPEEKVIGLDGFLAAMKDKYGGKTSVGSQLGDIGPDDIIPSGILSLDIASGLGGFVKGRIVDIYGPEASGKSLVGYHIIGRNMQLGRRCLLLDVEGTANSEFLQMLGVDTNNNLLQIMRSGSEPMYAEDWFEVLKTALDSKAFAIIMIDSVPALQPRAVATGVIGEDKSPAQQAQIMSIGLASIVQRAISAGTLVIFINQLRARPMQLFGNPIQPTGGNALKFYSSYRLSVKQTGKKTTKVDFGAKKLESVTGYKVLYTFEKNKLAPAYATAEFWVDFKNGVDYVGDTISCAESAGIVGKAGSSYWYYPNNEEGLKNKVNGEDNFRQWVESQPDMLDTIRDQVLVEVRKLTDDSSSVTTSLDEE